MPPKGQIYAWAVVLGACVVGAIVWLVPTLFADSSAVREVVVTILIGLAAILLGTIAVRNMRAEAGDRSFWPSLILLIASQLDLKPRSRGPIARAPRGIPEAEPPRPETSMRLPHVDLRDAALPGADLSGTDMTEASLRGANLNAALMHHSDLQGADLSESSLGGASLKETRLDGANLRGANLRGANLWGASLRDALLEGAIYDDKTVWPGTAPPPAELGAKHIEESS
jgi:hypothetical protein